MLGSTSAEDQEGQGVSQPGSARNRVADDIRRQITEGHLTPGDRLPSENALAESYGLNRSTVRRALDQLRFEGLITSRQGLGYFVPIRARLVWDMSRPERNTDTDLSPSDAWSTQMREQGHEPAERIEVVTERPTDVIAERLRMDAEQLVVVRRRVRLLDGEPVTLADSYYRHDLVAGTPVAEPGDVLPGVYAVFEDLGKAWTGHSNEVRARAATLTEARRLDVLPGTVVIEHIRTSVTADDEPVRCAVSIARGDRTVVVWNQEETT
jgi:GntR family transcriptional regulator